MNSRSFTFVVSMIFAAVTAAGIEPVRVHAQARPAPANISDLSGLWEGPGGSANIVQLLKVSPDLIKYTVTYDDPVFFTKPWTLTVDIKKPANTRLIEYVCLENEKDRQNLAPTPRQ